jgi:hypothetical protein
MALVYEYQIGEGGNWIEASGSTVSLTGLDPGTMYAFRTRAKDEAGNYSDPTPWFYETTPYRLAFVVDNEDDLNFVRRTEDGEFLTALVGNFQQRP